MSKISELLRRKRIDMAQRKSTHTPNPSSENRLVNWDKHTFRILAEIKRSSLSAGGIRRNLDLEQLARSYESAGAAAISVLTEEHYFEGSLADLTAVRRSVSVPVLQKDFVLDEFQILEAKEAGADFVLLIARFLTTQEIRHFLEVCDRIQINAVVEVTDENDLRKIKGPVRFLGVNARDLETLQVDTSRFEKMRGLLPDAYLIAESGIDSIETLRKVTSLGYNGALIGEHFLRAEDPAKELARFVGATLVVARTGRDKPCPYRLAKVKICGITNERDAQLAIQEGASALGFVFAESPRRVSPGQLKSFRNNISVPCVGVFRGNKQNEIQAIVDECRLDIAQIYDSCSVSIPAWKARTATSLDQISELVGKNQLVDIKLSDSDLPAAWKLLGQQTVFALAGGLHPGNVSQAISLCRPEWVDVARGVEKEPGIKDEKKLREFMKAVKGS